MSARIAILDDLCPHPLSRSTWRAVEFEAYLKHFPESRIYITLASKHLIDTVTDEAIMQDYSDTAPREWVDRVQFIDVWDSRDIREPDLFYCIFLNDVFLSLPVINRFKRPFFFTLYLGGGFRRFNEESDAKLRTVLSSSYFQGVVVTSVIIYDYLVDNGFCTADRICPFCTDDVGNGQNCGQYIPDEEIKIIPADAEQIFSSILCYPAKPSELKRLGEADARKARSLYSYQTQVELRIRWLEEGMRRTRRPMGNSVRWAKEFWSTGIFGST
jgi:hypothetical protein